MVDVGGVAPDAASAGGDLRKRPVRHPALRISVFGLGYVGCVSAACWANNGHAVVGVDINTEKVELLRRGLSPISEARVEPLLTVALEAGSFCPMTDTQAAVLNTDVSCICVGTPNGGTSKLDLSAMERVCTEIGRALRRKVDYHVVAVRSTILPGTTESFVIPLLEAASGKVAGRDFGVAYNPEFLREGTAVRDFHEASRTIIGELDHRSGETVSELYSMVTAPVVYTSLAAAEMIKLIDNAFHAVKVTFANEVGSICKQLGLDGRHLMEMFCLDAKMNLSPAYLKPGGPFGGSCLPKDLRALIGYARQSEVVVPMLGAVLDSNEQQKRTMADVVRQIGHRSVGVFGLSFKHGTDDLRGSPAVELVETLVGKGFHVRVYDGNVNFDRLMGSNLVYIERELPHVSRLLDPSLAQVLQTADTVVVTSHDPEFAGIPRQMRKDQVLVDLVGLPGAAACLGDRYHGIAW